MVRYGALIPVLSICGFACQGIVGIDDTSLRHVDAAAGSGGGGAGGSGGSGGSGGVGASGGSSGAGATGGSSGSGGSAGDAGTDALACDDFVVSPIAGVSLSQGNTIQANVEVTLGSCFTSAIDVTAPTVNKVSITPAQLAVGATAGSVTVNTQGDTPFGMTTLSLTFSGGGKLHVADLSVTVKGTSGELDPSFAIYTTAGNVRALSVEPDGDIVVGINPGASNTGWAVQRLKPDGTLDASFTAPAQLPGSGALMDLTVAANGQIAMVGDVSGGNGVAVVRLSSTGAPDPVLGANGTYTISDGVFPQEISSRAVAVPPDNKILFAGTMITEGALGRVDPNGPSVPPYPGKTDLHKTFPDAVFSFVGVQSSRYVVGGTSNSHVFVAGVLPTGVNDSSFGTSNGTASHAPAGFESINDGVLTSGAIFLCGAMQGGADVYPAIYRFTPDGKNPSHTHRDPPEGYNYRYYGCAAQADGKIVAVGYGGTGASGYRSIVSRFNPDGSPDTTFAAQQPLPGTKVFQVGGNSYFRAIAVAPDGTIVIGGSTPSGATVVRIWD